MGEPDKLPDGFWPEWRGKFPDAYLDEFKTASAKVKALVWTLTVIVVACGSVLAIQLPSLDPYKPLAWMLGLAALIYLLMRASAVAGVRAAESLADSELPPLADLFAQQDVLTPLAREGERLSMKVLPNASFSNMRPLAKEILGYCENAQGALRAAWADGEARASERYIRALRENLGGASADSDERLTLMREAAGHLWGATSIAKDRVEHWIKQSKG